MGARTADQLICDFDATPRAEEETSISEGEGSGEDEAESEAYSEEGWDSANYPNDTIMLQIQRYVAYQNSDAAQAVILCLLLVPTSSSSSPSEFRRVGTAEVPYISGLGRDGWNVRELKII
jgi:hypothetical protein